MKRTRWRRWRDYVTGWSIKYDIYTSFRAQTEHRALKRQSRVKKFTTAFFELWKRDVFLSAKYVPRKREKILIGSSQRYTFTLLRVFFFSFFFFLLPRSETVESDYDTRENPNSFWNGQFPLEESEKNEFRGESDKNISWYINRFDIECNNRKEYSFFFYRCMCFYLSLHHSILL